MNILFLISCHWRYIDFIEISHCDKRIFESTLRRKRTYITVNLEISERAPSPDSDVGR
jgi:hypothetical protein